MQNSWLQPVAGLDGDYGLAGHADVVVNGMSMSGVYGPRIWGRRPPALALENLLLKFPANFRYNGK
jgi:hypothetical protein